MSEQYCIVTDATADLPLATAQEYDIHVIPMECSLDDDAYEYEPSKKGLDPKMYYERMREDSTTGTSQINVFAYISFFTPILESGRDILYIAFSSGLTGSQQSAAIAIEELKAKFPERTILMVDSLAACLGEGLLVYTAAEKKAAGMPLHELAEWATREREHLCHWFTVDDLKYLERGGRLSSTAAFFGQALRIKPVLHVDDEGHLVALSKVQGRKKSLKALVDLMEETYTPDFCKTVFLGHADAEEDAEYVRDLIRERLGAEIQVIDYVGPIIGAHSGPGTIALFHFGTHK